MKKPVCGNGLTRPQYQSTFAIVVGTDARRRRFTPTGIGHGYPRFAHQHRKPNCNLNRVNGRSPTSRPLIKKRATATQTRRPVRRPDGFANPRVRFAGKVDRELIMDSNTNECPCCDTGALVVYTTRVDSELGVRTQYVMCRSCGYKASPRIVPLSHAPRRVRIGISRTIRSNRITQKRMF